MHAGIVMGRVLEFMCHGTTGRHRQEGNDGEGDNPHNAFEAGTSHMTKTKPGGHANKLVAGASTQLFTLCGVDD